MRSIKRDQRVLYYAAPIGTTPVLDEYGNDTLEVRTEYSEPIKLSVSVSANVGQEAMNVFGAQTEYSRTVSMTSTCPLVEGCKVWFGVAATESNNYTVVKVADSKNGFLVALREVSKRG